MRLGLPAPGLKNKAQVQVLTLSSPTAAPENVALTLLGGHHHWGSVPQAPCAPKPPRPLPAPTHTREHSPAFPRNPNGRLDLPGPTQEEA